MRLLLAGFDRFGGLSTNPAEEIVRRVALSQPTLTELIPLVLPTTFHDAGVMIKRALHAMRPNALIILGVAQGSHSILLERVARNIDHSDSPDNKMEVRRNMAIESAGPFVYESTLPLEKLKDALTSMGLAIQHSTDAGTYVCNHVFYVAMHEITRSKLSTQCGLIHIPLASEQIEAANPLMPSIGLDLMAKAIERSLRVVERELRGESGGWEQDDTFSAS